MKAGRALLSSMVEGITWPAVPTRPASEILAQLFQLEQSQWWSEDALRQCQLDQFALLARHAATHSPFYRASLPPEGPWDESRFRALPLLTRAELLRHADAIHCRSVPPSHGSIQVLTTSGSTGQVVSVKRTGINQLLWLAHGMRDHLWHARDFGQTLAVVRANAQVQDDDTAAKKNGWGPPASLLYATGPSYVQPMIDVGAQVEWLVRRSPGYLLTYPTNLAALLNAFERSQRSLPGLLEVRTLGETLSRELRARCKKVLGVRVVDGYSSNEVGSIALECPESGLYHVQAESLIVEVLDDSGSPCRPGEVGRVVVTDLHNFATPILRYELRDRAERGPACPCGRGLPTLARILGRERNMVVLPNGERRWPLVGMHEFRTVGPILQYQLVQHDLEEIEMRLVTEGAPLSAAQEERLTAVVQSALGHPFRLRFTRASGEIGRSAGGKFEEFVCLVEPSG